MKFNFWRIWEYFKLSKEVYYWDNMKITICFHIIYLIWITIFVYLLISLVDINNLIKNSSQELINAFTIISWFMLTWISIMLATWKVENIEKLKKNYNKDSDDEVYDIINKLKKILFYEILFQFIIIIMINILIALIKGLDITNSIVLITFLVLTFLSLIMTYRLINNFIAFENIIWFKIDK
jgi:hypothetical protein